MQYIDRPAPLLSWGEAFRLYLKDPHANRLLRHIAVRFLPVAIAVDALDDFIPFVGWIDDLFWPILIVLVVQMLIKVNGYRYQRPARPVIDQ